MKNLIIILLTAGLWGCTQQDYIVQSDRSVDTDFEQYSTYALSAHASSQNVQYVLQDLELKLDIREAIRDEMEAKGYTLNPENPDLLVNFRVFEEPTEVRGYEQETSYWMGDEVRAMGEPTTYQLEAGSLVVDLVDTESGAVVWKGYASGILEEDKFDRSEQSIATAVDMIFDQYTYRADDL